MAKICTADTPRCECCPERIDCLALGFKRELCPYLISLSFAIEVCGECMRIGKWKSKP